MTKPRAPAAQGAARETLDQLRTHRRRADRVLDRLGPAPATSAYGEWQSGLADAVGRSFRGRRGAAWSPEDTTRVRTVLNAQLRQLPGQLDAAMKAATRDALTESARGLARFATAMNQGDGHILDDDTEIEALVRRGLAAAESSRRDAIARVTARIAQKMRDRIQYLGTGDEKVRDVLSEIMGEIAHEQWEIERLARTQAAASFNAVQAAGIRKLRKQFPGMMMRWTEMVDDATGLPLDNRVAIDSIVLHGQVAAPGKEFTMPPDPRAPSKMVGLSWAMPPNRPNDRAVLVPWMPGQGVPGWVWRGGRVITR